MADADLGAELRRFEKYVRDLETSQRRLAVENAQLRVSHSFRLGNAFVQFAKRPRLGGIVALIRDIRLSMRPLNAQVPQIASRQLPKLTSLKGSAPQDALQKAVEESPIGSAVATRVLGRHTRIVGIIGDEIQSRLQGSVAQPLLAYDRYDSEWPILQPTHLVVDVDRFPLLQGWENAFTLRDPAATIEVVAMLQKARQSNIRTVLVEPSQPYRYPLLSRARPLFDMLLSRDEVTPERLLAS